MAGRRSAGAAGEDAAARFLADQGFRILERNFRFRGGEVDLVAVESDTLVFVEVKAWSSYGIDALEQGVDTRKQRRIIETAKYFLSIHREYRYMAVRFDVIFVAPGGITHLPAAFSEGA